MNLFKDDFGDDSADQEAIERGFRVYRLIEEADHEQKMRDSKASTESTRVSAPNSDNQISTDNHLK